MVSFKTSMIHRIISLVTNVCYFYNWKRTIQPPNTYTKTSSYSLDKDEKYILSFVVV